MADVSKRFARGYASPNKDLVAYTVPAGKRSFVKAVTLCCVSSPGEPPAKVTMELGNITVIHAYPLKSSETLTIPFLDQIIEAGETIKIWSVDGVASYYISGREVDI